jgi:chromosome segregation ATPase
MKTRMHTANNERKTKETKSKYDLNFLDSQVQDNEQTINQILETQASHTREMENGTKTTSILDNRLTKLETSLQEKMDNLLKKMMAQFESIKNKPPEAITQTSKRSRMSSLTASNQTSPSKRTQDQVYTTPQHVATLHQDEDQVQKKLCTIPGTANMSMEDDLDSKPDDDPEKDIIFF